MLCRHCGTEIADKAIVCYRCGRATTDPVRKPAEVRRRRGPLLTVVVVGVLILLALYLGQAGRTAGGEYARVKDILALALAVTAVLLLALRLRRRR